MRLRNLSITLLFFAVAGCAAAQLQSAQQLNEKADTTAALIYAAIANTADAFCALPSTPAPNCATAQNVKKKAWIDFKVAHAAFIAGNTVILSALQADQADASAVTGQAVTPAAAGPISSLDHDGALVLADFRAPQGETR